eukprot:9679669-Alexandrium_andersonii.AAC.1
MGRPSVEAPVGPTKVGHHVVSPRCAHCPRDVAHLPPPRGGEGLPQAVIDLTTPLFRPPTRPPDPQIRQ